MDLDFMPGSRDGGVLAGAYGQSPPVGRPRTERTEHATGRGQWPPHEKSLSLAKESFWFGSGKAKGDLLL